MTAPSPVMTALWAGSRSGTERTQVGHVADCSRALIASMHAGSTSLVDTAVEGGLRLQHMLPIHARASPSRQGTGPGGDAPGLPVRSMHGCDTANHKAREQA